MIVKKSKKVRRPRRDLQQKQERAEVALPYAARNSHVVRRQLCCSKAPHATASCCPLRVCPLSLPKLAMMSVVVRLCVARNVKLRLKKVLLQQLLVMIITTIICRLNRMEVLATAIRRKNSS